MSDNLCIQALKGAAMMTSFFALASPALAHSGSAADAAPAPAPPAATTDSPPATGGDIIVTAQRRTERLRDVPFSIVSQTGDQLAKAGVTNIRDLGALVPGLTFTSQGAFVEPAIRGVSTSLSGPGADSPIAVYVDGFYMPNQVSNAFDLPDVTRVEVLKGPQGTLFGRNATGGAISIITVEPGDHWAGNFLASEGVFTGGSARTANDTRITGNVSGPLTNTLSISLSGLYAETPGYLHNDVTGGRYGKVENYLGRVKIKWQPTADVKFTLAGTYSHRFDELSESLSPINGQTAGALFPGAIVPTQPWHVAGSMFGGGGSLIRDKDWGVYLTSEFTLGIGTLTSRTGYTWAHPIDYASIDGTYSPGCLAVFACLNYIADYGPSKTFQQEFSFASKKMGILTYSLGALYYHDDHFFSANINPPLDANGVPQVNIPGLESFAIDVKSKAYAGFGEAYIDLTPQLHLIGGLRYSWERATANGAFSPLFGPIPAFGPVPGGTWHAFTPRASIRYDLSGHTNVYATYSQGFKSGVVNYNTFQPAASPEKLTSYEVGLKTSSAAFSLNAAAFYYDYKDLQVQFFNGATTRYANAANAKIWGFDVDSTAVLTSNLSLRLAGSWLPHAKYENFVGGSDFIPPLVGNPTPVAVDGSGLRITRTPKVTGNATLTYNQDVAWGKLDASTTLYYSSSYHWDLLGIVQTGSYATVNAQIGLTLQETGVHLSLWGKNLSNKAYITSTLTGGNANIAGYGAPREIGVSAGYKF